MKNQSLLKLLDDSKQAALRRLRTSFKGHITEEQTMDYVIAYERNKYPYGLYGLDGSNKVSLGQ